MEWTEQRVIDRLMPLVSEPEKFLREIHALTGDTADNYMTWRMFRYAFDEIPDVRILLRRIELHEQAKKRDFDRAEREFLESCVRAIATATERMLMSRDVETRASEIERNGGLAAWRGDCVITMILERPSGMDGPEIRGTIIGTWSGDTIRQLVPELPESGCYAAIQLEPIDEGKIIVIERKHLNFNMQESDEQGVTWDLTL